MSTSSFRVALLAIFAVFLYSHALQKHGSEKLNKGTVHLLTSIPGRQESHLIGGAELMQYDTLMENIGNVFGIPDMDNQTLEYTGDLLRPQDPVRISTASEWVFLADKLAYVAKVRSSAASKAAYYDWNWRCSNCRHVASFLRWDSCKHCGHFAQPEVIEPFKVQVLKKPDTPSQAQ